MKILNQALETSDTSKQNAIFKCINIGKEISYCYCY